MTVSNLTTVTAGVFATLKVMRHHQGAYRLGRKAELLLFLLYAMQLQNTMRAKIKLQSKKPLILKTYIYHMYFRKY